MSDNEKYVLELASEKGASNWLNAQPRSRYNFNLNKSEFRDGIYLRYFVVVVIVVVNFQ